MRILALDLGQSKSVACVVESGRQEENFETVRTEASALRALLARWRPDRVTMEIGPVAGWVHDLAVAYAPEVEVANPNDVAWSWRRIKKKTDREDAKKLARLSLLGQVKTVYMPSASVRQRRSLIGYRKRLVERVTAMKNHLRSILVRQGMTWRGGKSGWTAACRVELMKQAKEWADCGAEELWRGELYQELVCLAQAEAAVEAVEKKLRALNGPDERVRLLRTVDGVGERLAEALVAAIDDPHRFGSGRQVASYFGLTPRQYQSGHSDRQGRISGQGNKLVRSLLVEVSWLGLRHNAWMREIYERVNRGSPARKKIAIVAVARRLAVLCWAMLRDGCPWRAPVRQVA
jgi:transposase